MSRCNCTFLSLVIVMALAGCSKKVTKSEQLLSDTRDKFPQKKVETVSDKAPAVRLNDLLSTIYFDYNQSVLRSDAIRALERIAPYLANQSAIRLQAEGHCDERGSSEYNMGLGEQRSRSVKQWLVAYGIPQSRIEITSYGKERPVNAYCGNESCHELNRRVEWKILSMPDRVASGRINELGQ
ncbi:MAG: OmpA family protein [Chitinispirillaceae bacterium]|nr:OmpA family protein [Chitinispirillaceae bacterium]